MEGDERVVDFGLLKEAGAAALAVANLILLGIAVVAYRGRRSLPQSYFQLVPLSAAVAVYQVGLGITFVLFGKRPPLMHVFYGILVGLFAVGQGVLRWTPLGQRYRGKPIVHGFFALVIMLLSIRSWMSA